MSQESRKTGKELRDSDITEAIIVAAISVHRELGPGFIESVYEQALAVEFALCGIAFVRQKAIPLVELKAIESLDTVHFAIVRSYLKASGLAEGLILNFSSMPLTVKRVRRERTSVVPDLRQ